MPGCFRPRDPPGSGRTSHLFLDQLQAKRRKKSHKSCAKNWQKPSQKSTQKLPNTKNLQKSYLQQNLIGKVNVSAYGEQGPAKLSRHKAAKPLNLDHAAKPRSHKATCRHSLTGASQRHKAAKPQKTQNVVEFECTKGAAKASRNTLACMAGHEPRLWCFSSLWRFETLPRFETLSRFDTLCWFQTPGRSETLWDASTLWRLQTLGRSRGNKGNWLLSEQKKGLVSKSSFLKKCLTIVVLLKINIRRFPRRILRNTTLEDFSQKTTFILTIVSKTSGFY